MLEQSLLKDLNILLFSSVKKFIQQFKAILRHHRGVKRAVNFSKQKDLRLNLGCGPKVKSGWVNIDLGGNVDLTLDLQRPFPFLSDSCAVIYSEHFFEHIDYPEPALSILRESYRILQPDGSLSLGVPDTEWPLLEYAGVRNDEYFNLAKKHWHPKWCTTKMEHINYHFRQGPEHKFAYDFNTLEKILRLAGFINIRRREFDPKLDSKDRELGTLYIEAFKPVLNKS